MRAFAIATASERDAALPKRKSAQVVLRVEQAQSASLRSKRQAQAGKQSPLQPGALAHRYGECSLEDYAEVNRRQRSPMRSRRGALDAVMGPTSRPVRRIKAGQQRAPGVDRQPASACRVGGP